MEPKKDNKVAIVDDEGEVTEVLQRYLEKKGFDVKAVASGEEALGILEHTPPTFWVIDVKLPGMDGVTLAKRIKEQTPEAVVFLLTGYPYDKILPDITDANIEQLIEKPLDPRLLVELLRVH
jgi:DNA-binding response OmpR family regulator